MAYNGTLQIAGLTLLIPPEQYAPRFKKLGAYIRTVGGGLLDFNMNGYRLTVEIRGITVTQIEDLKRRAALKKSLTFLDYVPIAEKSTRSRTVYEDLGSESVQGETIYLYVPQYNVLILDLVPNYRGAILEYTLSLEEV
jgi:hypothetical protein